MTIDQKFVPVLCLIVGLVLGFTGERIFTGKSKNAGNTEAVKARLIAMGTFPQQMSEVKQLSGSITSVDGDRLTVALSYPRDPFGDPSLDERTVTIDDNTKITIVAQKDQKVFEKELALYQSEMKAIKPGAVIDPSKMPTPPQVFDKKTGERSSLKVGQTVSITTAENVKDEKSFIALALDVSPGVVSPPALEISTAGTVSPLPPTTASSAGTGAILPPPPSTRGASAIPPPLPTGVNTDKAGYVAPVTTAGTVGVPDASSSSTGTTTIPPPPPPVR